VQRLQFRIQELEAENAALRSGLIQTR